MKKAKDFTCCDQFRIDKRIDPERLEKLKSGMFQIVKVVNSGNSLNSPKSFGKNGGCDIGIFPVGYGNKKISLFLQYFLKNVD